MTLWHLKRTSDIEFDECDAVVVRASSEQEARSLAYEKGLTPRWTWTDPNESTCEEIVLDGPVEVILVSYRAG